MLWNFDTCSYTTIHLCILVYYCGTMELYNKTYKLGNYATLLLLRNVLAVMKLLYVVTV